MMQFGRINLLLLLLTILLAEMAWAEFVPLMIEISSRILC